MESPDRLDQGWIDDGFSLPADPPNELGVQVLWLNSAAPSEMDSCRLGVGGIAKKPQHPAIEHLWRCPDVEPFLGGATPVDVTFGH